MESARLLRLSIILHAKVLELFFCRNTRITEEPKHTPQRRCILKRKTAILPILHEYSLFLCLSRDYTFSANLDLED